MRGSAAGSDVVPLVLAAGASSRMGRCKAALPFGDRSALQLILAQCAQLGTPIVVAGAEVEAVRAAAADGVHLVENPRWAEGRTTSIQAGLLALPPAATAFLLWPVDACLPGAQLVAALLDARRRRPAAWAWVPSHARRRGHPVLFARAAAERFASLGPDEPARGVIHALAEDEALVHVAVDDPAVLMNMNTPADYQRWLAEHRRRTGAVT